LDADSDPKKEHEGVAENRSFTNESEVLEFQIIENLKGESKQPIRVFTSHSSCAPHAQIGQRYLVFVDENHTTDICMGTRLLAQYEVDDVQAIRGFRKTEQDNIR
jgi:hypothetical protein